MASENYLFFWKLYCFKKTEIDEEIKPYTDVIHVKIN